LASTSCTPPTAAWPPSTSSAPSAAFTSTEPHARLRDKLDRYEELALALEHPLTLLFVVPSERREHHILDRLPAAGGVRVLTTTAERHHADPLARNWLTAGAERRAALGEPTSRPQIEARPTRRPEARPGQRLSP
jgi:hypothetical protein